MTPVGASLQFIGAILEKLGKWLGGGFKYVFFTQIPGDMDYFDKYFSKGLTPAK